MVCASRIEASFEGFTSRDQMYIAVKVDFFNYSDRYF